MIIKYWINGRPATYATDSEKKWKKIIVDSLTGTENTFNCLKLEFNLSKENYTKYAFDIDNLCEPVFAALTRGLGWYGGKRVNIERFIATKSVGNREGVKIFDVDVPNYKLINDKLIFENIYEGKLPNKATDLEIINWVDQFDNNRIVSQKCSMRIQFGKSRLSIATISGGKVKPVIDSMYAILGGRVGNPDDHKITELIVEKNIFDLNESQIRISIWEDSTTD